MPPLYQYACDSCQGVEEAFRSVADRAKVPDCSVCGTPTRKVVAGYSVHGDMEPYYDENLETYIKGKQHRKRVMRERGVSEKFGKGWM